MFNCQSHKTFRTTGDCRLTNCLRVIRNALCLVVKVVCGSIGIALITS
ncbi:DUF3265 domain-containing protein [Vibrio vulnificus]|nr:DUF3265 domain-containing protein [Vibrio vulnificus]